MANCTYIDGIGSSQAIDTAGEIVDLAGIDCSSLVGAAFNYEHESKLPSQICGKILEYKKIFSDKDCENDRHAYYWEKCKTPFLYVMGRLFDDKKDSSREVAALFMDDAEHPDEQPMVGFSIEGSKIDKVGLIVTKSVARKITLTNIPANKTCVAEMIPADPEKTDSDSIFKSEPSFTIELLSKGQNPGKKFPSDAQRGGQPSYLVGSPKNRPIAARKSGTKNHRMAVASSPKFGPVAPKAIQGEIGKGESMKKAMTAGSGMTAPGNMVGGAALGKEALDKKMKKSTLLQRAEQEYKAWGKREAFETYMSKTMPHLAKGEIAAIGQVLCLNKSMKAEKKLAKMMVGSDMDSFVEKKEKK